MSTEEKMDVILNFLKERPAQKVNIYEKCKEIWGDNESTFTITYYTGKVLFERGLAVRNEAASNFHLTITPRGISFEGFAFEKEKNIQRQKMEKANQKILDKNMKLDNRLKPISIMGSIYAIIDILVNVFTRTKFGLFSGLIDFFELAIERAFLIIP